MKKNKFTRKQILLSYLNHINDSLVNNISANNQLLNDWINDYDVLINLCIISVEKYGDLTKEAKDNLIHNLPALHIARPHFKKGCFDVDFGRLTTLAKQLQEYLTTGQITK